MQLRKAQQEDIPALYTLWEEAFGDTKETIDLFFDTCFQMQNTLVAVCDGQVRSVIYLLRNVLQNGGEAFSASYIYAAATEKTYRGKGLMHALLTFVAETETARGTDFLYLVPASAHLFRYYGKCGYHIAFGKQICTFSRVELQSFAEIVKSNVPYIAWNRAVLQFSKKLAQQFGDHCICNGNGLAVWTQTGDCLEVTELYAADGRLSELLQALLRACKAMQFTLPLPCTAPTEKCENTAMLKALSERAKAQNIQNAYIGLTLG